MEVPLKNGGAETADFNRKRRHNALRLKNRFADIIDRYSHDFSDVGDVIDLGSEKLVVDNGHLENMMGELDPAYDQIWVDTDSEKGDVEVVENEEDIDELCSDMMTEKEKAAVKGMELPMTNETRRDSPSEVTQKHNQTAATFPEEEQLALVTVPPPTLMPTISQNTFQAPMFPQLEKAVNTMTSMLQQQMMAMLGVVHPPQVSQAILPAQIPQAIAEPPRQIFPAQAPHSLKRRFETLTPSPVAVIREHDRIYAQSPDPHFPSPKTHPLKRRRISDIERRKEDYSMRVPGRNESGASGTPPARTLQAPRKTPNSMPARPQRPSLIQSNSDSRAGTKEIARSSHTELISTISQLLQGDEASEDELGPSFTPARAKVVFRRDTSPKVVVSPRPKGKEEAYGMAGDDTPTRVAHLPARKRRHKSRILATEEDSEGEFLMSLPVDDSEDDSDFKPPQPSPTALSPEAKLEAMLKRSRPSKYARKSDCGLQFGLPLARTIFEHDLSSLRLAHPALKPKSGRMGRQHETPQLVFETNVPLAQKNTKTCVTCSAKEPPDWKWMSATVCNVCIVKDVEAGKRMIKVEDKKGKTQNRSRKNASNGKRERPTRDKVMVEGPATIMDMTVAEVTPVLTEQSRAEMAPALLEKPREKTVMFAPEAEIIPDPEEE